MPLLAPGRFLQALPEAVRAQLPPALSQFRSQCRWGWCQIYYHDPAVHYEIWNLGERRHRLEIGLHFESRVPGLNAKLVHGFSQHLTEIKARLGPRWEAEIWNGRWTKVYETVPYTVLDTELVSLAAQRLAHAIILLQPTLEDLLPAPRHRARSKSAG